MPQNNVLYAYIGGLLAVILEHIAKQYGYVPTPDISAALPAAIAVGIAHAIDLWNANKTK